MWFSRTLGCRVAAVSAVVLLVSGFARSAAAETISIYTETFPNATTTNIALNTSTIGWGAYGGSGCTDQANVADGCTVSFYIGTGGTKGLAFTKIGSYTGYRSLVATSEFSAIKLSSFSSLTFSWEQWNANVNQKSQLAIQIDGTWYVSANTFATASKYGVKEGTTVLANGESKSLTLSVASGWYALTVIPSTTNGLGVGAAASLPTTGNIVAAGLYCTDTSASPNAGDALCIDNFQINGVAVPEPGTMALLAGALLGLVAYAWRKRK